MKRPILVSLLAALAFASCETAHNAAVSTYRVVAAPVTYVGHKLGVDEENQQTTTTQTNVQSSSAANPPSQPYPVQQPASPPPVQTQRPVVTTGQPPSQPKLQPTATPRVVQRENPPPSGSPVPPVAISSQSADLPYAKPVPGKPGYVFSPFDKNGGYVDVTGYSPGQKVKDPYTGKIFLVP
jgi:hypothetical protein